MRVSGPVQDVLRLEISVDDVVFVQVLDGREDLAVWEATYNGSSPSSSALLSVWFKKRDYE